MIARQEGLRAGELVLALPVEVPIADREQRHAPAAGTDERDVPALAEQVHVMEHAVDREPAAEVDTRADDRRNGRGSSVTVWTFRLRPAWIRNVCRNAASQRSPPAGRTSPASRPSRRAGARRSSGRAQAGRCRGCSAPAGSGESRGRSRRPSPRAAWCRRSRHPAGEEVRQDLVASGEARTAVARVPGGRSARSQASTVAASAGRARNTIMWCTSFANPGKTLKPVMNVLAERDHGSTKQR